MYLHVLLGLSEHSVINLKKNMFDQQSKMNERRHPNDQEGHIYHSNFISIIRLRFKQVHSEKQQQTTPHKNPTPGYKSQQIRAPVRIQGPGTRIYIMTGCPVTLYRAKISKAVQLGVFSGQI
jgi:hypothetical protein